MLHILRGFCLKTIAIRSWKSIVHQKSKWLILCNLWRFIHPNGFKLHLIQLSKSIFTVFRWRCFSDLFPISFSQHRCRSSWIFPIFRPFMFRSQQFFRHEATNLTYLTWLRILISFKLQLHVYMITSLESFTLFSNYWKTSLKTHWLSLLYIVILLVTPFHTMIID